MNEMVILEYFGAFAVAWALGFSISYKLLTFKRLADEATS